MEYKYYGWSKFGNLGDDILQTIAETKGFKLNNDSKNLLIGGGTILPLYSSHSLYKRTIQNNPENIVVYGTGVSDPVNPKELEFTKEFLKNCKHIGLRDEGSRKALGFGEVIGDPFFHIKWNKSLSKEQKKNYVAVSLSFDGGDVIGGSMAQLDATKEILKFCKYFLIEKMKYKILPLLIHRPRDDMMVSLINKYIGKENIYKTDSVDYFDIIKNASMVLAYKQHVFITALCLNTPVISIAYQSKIINVAKDFNIKPITLDKVTYQSLVDYYENIKEFNFDEVNKKIEEYYKKGNEFLSKVEK